MLNKTSKNLSKDIILSPSVLEGIHKILIERDYNVLLTVRQVAEILQTNVDYVYRLKDSGLLQFIKVGQYKVLRETLLEFLKTYQGKDITNPFDVKELNDAEDKCEG